MSETLAEATGPKMAVALPCANRSMMRTNNVDAARYVNGNVAKTSAPANSNRRRPNTSDKAPAGSFTTMPVSVDAPITKPISDGPAPRSRAKSGRRGVRQIAQLQYATNPAPHRRMSATRAAALERHRSTAAGSSISVGRVASGCGAMR